MTRDEMRTMIRALIRLDNTTALPNATIDLFLNEGHDEVISYTDWPFLYATGTTAVVAGVGGYTIALDQIDVVVIEQDDRALRPLSRVEYLRLVEEVNTAGEPTHYFFNEGNANLLFLWPPPASSGDTLRWFGRARTTLAAADASLPAWAEQFHTVLVDWAMHRLWEREEDFDRSAEYRQRFETKLGRMFGFYNRQTQLRPSAYGGGLANGSGTNLPFLSDAVNGGATG